MAYRWSLGLIALIFLAFFVSPLIHLVMTGIGDLASRSSVAGGAVAPGLGRTLKFSALQAFLSSVLSVAAALPGAYAISHYRFRARRFFQSLSLVPFVLPSVIVIICMISFYGRSGVLNTILGTKFNLIYNFSGILLAHLFYNFAIALRIVGDGWSRISDEYGEVARGLGDTRSRVFFKITLPLLLPSIASALVLVFIYCFMSFGIVLVFGGVKYATLEVRIYQELFQRLDYARGSVYAVVQLGVSVGFLAISSSLAGRQSGRKTSIRRAVPLKHASTPVRVAISLYWVLVAVFVFGPICSMVYRSFVGPSGMTLAPYRALFESGAGARNVEGLIRSTIPAVIARSLFMAVLSGTATFVIAVSAALLLRRRRAPFWRGFYQMPLGMTVVGLAAGLRLLFGEIIPPLVLVMIGQFFLAFPMVFRIASTVVGDLHQGLIECAQSLGARPGYALRTVTIPVLRRGLINAYAFAIALVFADFTIVLGVGRGAIVTFPVAIYRLIGFRSFDFALALSGLYILFCLLLFIVIDRTSFSESTDLKSAKVPA